MTKAFETANYELTQPFVYPKEEERTGQSLRAIWWDGQTKFAFDFGQDIAGVEGFEEHPLPTVADVTEIKIYAKATIFGAKLTAIQVLGEKGALLVDVGDETDCQVMVCPLGEDEEIVGVQSRVDEGYSQLEHYELQLVL